jgi:hypothetical protein
MYGTSTTWNRGGYSAATSQVEPYNCSMHSPHQDTHGMQTTAVHATAGTKTQRAVLLVPNSTLQLLPAAAAGAAAAGALEGLGQVAA